ncbi:MAG: T9SS type A sorting domain-containing protein [Bacteroidota bacterium]|nr:T9SS type A sorting domain-containing protein [Bacteroidota bacterium]MDP3145068.1 T9SS type A sorting domain-containing protein [Bacteroidota bacterium]
MRKVLLITCGLIFSIMTTTKAQISGVFTVPGSYASIAAAINDLNIQGVNGAVTINISAGYTETAPVGGFTLTATGSIANTITFKKNGVGANPLITAYVGGTGTPGTAFQDGVWRFVGSDYITVDGIDINDPNISNPSTMEFGYGFFKASATDGCQNNTIRNCVITLNRNNNATGTNPAVDGSRGIEFVNALTGAHTTVLSITAASGANSNNKVYSNTIQNCNVGVSMIGFADVTPFSNADTGNDVGGSSTLTGNTIVNFGGGTSATNPAAAIRTLAQYNFNASNNIINNNNGSGVNHVTTIRGIYLNTAVSANSSINNNTLTINGGGTTSQVSIIENLSGATAASNSVSINNNLIANCTNSTTTTGIWYGIFNNGASSANLSISNNSFLNNTTNATSGATYLIYNTGAVNSSININNNNLSFNHVGATANTGALYNIYNTGSSVTTSLNINNNNFSSYNHNVIGTGIIYFMYNLGSSFNFNLINNSINNLTLNHSGTEYYFYNNSATQNSLTISSNSVTNITRTGAAGTFYAFYLLGSSLPTCTQTIGNNIVSNITATVSGTGTFYGIYNTDGSVSPYPKKTITSNTISNINYASTGTGYGLYFNYFGDGSSTSGSNMFNNNINNIATNGAIYGLYASTLGSPTYPASVYTNTVSNITSNGVGSAIYGGYIGGGGAGINFFKNKIVDITQNGTTGTIFGLYLVTSPLSNIYNNLIGSLSTPSTTGANKLNGVYIASGTNINMYYNSVYIDGTSTGANFGSNAIYASTTPNVNLRNNVFVNNCTPTGTEFATAYRRSSIAIASYSNTSNNNLFYAGVAGPNNLIYYDGTTSNQTLGGYKTTVAPRDANSVTENPTFVSTVGSNPNFLNVNTVVPTQIESGAVTIAGITDDYVGTIRNVSTPDIGAWEGNYVFSGDISAPGFLASGFTSSACNLTSRTFTVNITDASGVASGSLSPRVYFQVNAAPYSSTQGSLTAGTSTNGVWTFSMSYAASVNDVISYYIVAQDIAATPNLGASPAAGFSGTSVNNVTTPPNTPNSYVINSVLSGTYTIGAAGNYTTLTAAANAYNTSCLVGPITFSLIDANYSTNETFPIIFTNNPDASSTNSLLVIPSVGNNVLIAGISSAVATIKFLNANHITFDGLNTSGSSLTVENPNIGTSTVIWLASTSLVGPGNNTIGVKRLGITGSLNASGKYGILIAQDAVTPTTISGIDNDNITIQGNTILNAYYGVYAAGSATVSAGGLDNLNITSNQIGPVTSGTNHIGYRGVFVSNAPGVNVSNNMIQNIFPGASGASGVYLNTGITGASVSQNTIANLSCTIAASGTGALNGIYVGSNVINSSINANQIYNVVNSQVSGYAGRGIIVNTANGASNDIIYNNMISEITGTGRNTAIYWPIGIAIEGTSGGINIYNNSVNMAGSFAGVTTATASTALYLNSSGANINITNNILSNTYDNTTITNDAAFSVYSSALTAANLTMDYNDYYVGGTSNIPVMGYINATQQLNIPAMQASFGGNLNSQNTAPAFTSIGDLHLVPATNALLDNTGTPIVGITVDIDNQVRNAVTPDVGADEFSAPTCTAASSGTLANNSYSVCDGQLITVTSNSVSAGAGTVYQWLSSTSATGPFTNVTGGSGANTPSYITNTLTTGNIYYQLQTTCTSLSLTSVSNVATVAINPVPTASVAAMAPICAGQNLTFTSTTNIGNTFSWTGPNSFTSNVQNPIIASVTTSANGIYTLVVSASNCSATAETTTVTVNSTILDISANPNFVCTSGTTTLTATGNALTYTWSTNSNLQSIVETVTATTVYSVVGTGTSNCQATAFATITVINPTITGVGTAVCNPTTVATLTANAFAPVSWYATPSSTVVLGSGNTFTATAPVTTTYYAQAVSSSSGSLQSLFSGGNGCGGGNMFDVTATNGAIVVDSLDVHTSVGAASTFSVLLYYKLGTYLGSETNSAAWIAWDTVVVTSAGPNQPTRVVPTTVLNLPNNQLYAIYLNYAANYTNGTNLYSNSDLSMQMGAGLCSLFGGVNAGRMFNGNVFYSKPGCTSPLIPVTLTVTSQPTITIASSQTSVCPNSSVTIGVTGATTYTWSTGGNGASIVVTPSASTIYTVVGENAPGCSGTNSIAITTNSVPVVNVSSSASLICVGQTATLTANGASSYVWNTSATTSVIAVSPTVNTTYTVNGTGPNSCSVDVVFTQSVSTCTGVDANSAFSNLISVFPNPSNGIINAEFNFEGQKEIVITNSVGQIITTIKTTNTSEIINLDKYAKGMYFVKITSNQNSANYRIILQ